MEQKKYKKPDGSLLVSKRVSPDGVLSWRIENAEKPDEQPTYYPLDEFDNPFDAVFDMVADHWDSIFSCWMRFRGNDTWHFCWNWIFNKNPEGEQNRAR